MECKFSKATLDTGHPSPSPPPITQGFMKGRRRPLHICSAILRVSAGYEWDSENVVTRWICVEHVCSGRPMKIKKNDYNDYNDYNKILCQIFYNGNA